MMIEQGPAHWSEHVVSTLEAAQDAAPLYAEYMRAEVRRLHAMAGRPSDGTIDVRADGGAPGDCIWITQIEPWAAWYHDGDQIVKRHCAGGYIIRGRVGGTGICMSPADYVAITKQA